MLACQLSAATLPENIERLIASSPVTRAAFWGIQIVDLTTGKTLYEQNADRFFIPASNAKLFTTAMAFTRLGGDFTFRTRVLASQSPGADGRLAGALRLVGGGDPNLSARAIPYRVGPTTGNPLAPLEDLADQVVAHGVNRVDGDIVGDDTWYVWQPYASGWEIEDAVSDDGAPVSALTVNDNLFTLFIRPGKSLGEPAALTLNPPAEYYRIGNLVRTVAAGGERRIHIDRVPGSMDLTVWGTIPLRDRGQDELLAIDDPALYAARVFRDLLERRGVAVSGGAVARHLHPEDAGRLAEGPAPAPESGIELASHTSAPFFEDLRITSKASQNLHAELALRAVARARRNTGSLEAGIEEMKAFLGEVGIEDGAYTLLDGSGLSRLDLVTPSAVMKLLRYMYRSPGRDRWIAMLPVSGRDGTLAARFGDNPAAGRIHAKTGSLSHVSALSGYGERADGHWIAFSILVNNYNGAPAEVRGAMDRICAFIME